MEETSMKPNTQSKRYCDPGLGLPSLKAISIGIAVVAALLLTASESAAAQTSPEALPQDPTQRESEPAPGTRTQAETIRIPPGLSAAEVLVRIRQLIAYDERRLRFLNTRRDELAREFEEASTRFSRLDEELRAARKSGTAATEIQALERRLALARDEVDQMLERRQARDQQINILQRKIETQKKALDLVAAGPAAPSPSTQAPAAPNAEAAEASESPSQQPPSMLPGPGNVAPTSEASPDAPAVPEAYDPRVADAAREFDRREGRLRLAEYAVQLVEQLASLNQDDLTQTQAVAEASRRRQEAVEDQVARLVTELEQLPSETPSRERTALEARVAETRRLAAEAGDSAANDAAQVAALASRVEDMNAARDSLAARVDELRSEVESARRRVEFLQSPLAPHRIMRWLLDAAPRVVAILVLVFLFWLGTRRLTHRVVSRMTKRGRRGLDDGRLERVETLRRVLQSVLAIAFLIVATLAVLPEFGVDVTVLLGGAAIFSLAIAYGAQNLVKDYFTGFMILMEDQYRVGNVVQINDKSGQVEDINLRITTLRDLEGIAHFIPHSQIATVSNLTYGWSRVVMDVGVAYKEDVGRVMEVLMELAREMRKEPEFSSLITDEPEMLGVDALTDSAVVVKLLLRARPLKQWIVKRELLRRVKVRFDELGIEIPFPHRTVYHRTLEGPLSVRLSNGVGEITDHDEYGRTTSRSADARAR
jgi:small-conductance mechanosensitive channel